MKGPINSEAAAHALAKRFQADLGRLPGVIDYKDGSYGLYGIPREDVLSRLSHSGKVPLSDQDGE